MAERRSAIIVTFRLPARIAAVRRRHVPVASVGVPPHVTILSPFVPAETLDSRVRARLAAIAGHRPSFDVRFERWAWFPDALYLVPNPARPFSDLIVDVAAAFPDYPPYADPTSRPEDVVPHLTVAIGDRAELNALVDVVTPSLPVSGQARAMTVIEEGVDGNWRTRWRLRLRP